MPTSASHYQPLSRPTPFTLIALGLCFNPCLPVQAEEATQELAEVVVSERTADGDSAHGYRRDRVSLGSLGQAEAIDTPLSISAISGELIRNIQAGTTADALKYTPTVYVSTGASQITPYFSLRGFSASTWTYNMAVDGMRSFDVWQPLEDKAAVEVLSGASGLLYGITSPAGMINYVTQSPSAAPRREITVGAEAEALFARADLAGALRPDIHYRVNVGYTDPGENGTAHQTQQHYTLSGAIDWKVAPSTMLTLDAVQARRKVEQPQALFVPSTASGIPDAADARRNWGPSEGQATDVTQRVGAALRSQLTEQLGLRAALRVSDDQRGYYMGRQYWKNEALDYTWRLDAQDDHHRRATQYLLFLDAEFDTGPLKHALSVGNTWDDFTEGYDGYRSLTTTTVYPGNLGDAYPTAPDLSPAAKTATSQELIYSTWTLVDRISLGDRWSVTLGGNRAAVRDTTLSRAPSTGVVTRSDYDAEKFTPAAALSYKWLPTLSTYVSYLESLQEGFTSTASGNYGERFAPYVGRQKEAGIKAQYGELGLNLAYFRIDQANYMVVDDFASQDGKAVHKGWEFSLTGRVSPRLTLTGGFTLLDAEVEKAASNVGKTPQGVPERMAKLYAEYEVPGLPGLTLTGGLSHVGKVPVDAANTLYVDAVTLGDVGARYRTRIAEHDTTVRLTVNNVADKDYWSTRSGMLYLGAPRTLALSATVAF